MNNLDKEVMDFFKINDGLHIKVKDEKSIINPQKLLNDEAEIILELFFDKFNVKGIENLYIDKYFYNLTDFGLKYWLSLLKLKKYVLPPKPHITIAHMIEVAKRKEWFEPE